MVTFSLVSMSKLVALTGMERSETIFCAPAGDATASATVTVVASMNAGRTIQPTEASSAIRNSKRGAKSKERDGGRARLISGRVFRFPRVDIGRDRRGSAPTGVEQVCKPLRERHVNRRIVHGYTDWREMARTRTEQLGWTREAFVVLMRNRRR